jgi:hypothetical protein
MQHLPEGGVMNDDQKARWQGPGADLVFDRNDFEILDLVTNLSPELRVSAAVLKQARAANLAYPIERVDDLIQLLNGERFIGGGHHITDQSIKQYMPAEFFPIEHEGDLVSRVYMALLRCKHEWSLAAQVRPETVRESQELNG